MYPSSRRRLASRKVRFLVVMRGVSGRPTVALVRGEWTDAAGRSALDLGESLRLWGVACYPGHLGECTIVLQGKFPASPGIAVCGKSP